MNYGYARTSTRAQKLKTQIEDIQEYGHIAKRNIYSDQDSGKTQNRESWKKLYSKLVEGDKLYMLTVDRMSRNATDGVKEYFELVNRGIEIIFVKEPMLNSSVYGDSIRAVDSIKDTGDNAVDPILAGIRVSMINLAKRQIEQAFATAEYNREMIVDKVMRGIEGKEIGRKKGCDNSHLKKDVPTSFKALVNTGEKFNVSAVAKEYGVSRTTIYSWKKQLETK